MLIFNKYKFSGYWDHIFEKQTPHIFKPQVPEFGFLEKLKYWVVTQVFFIADTTSGELPYYTLNHLFQFARLECRHRHPTMYWITDPDTHSTYKNQQQQLIADMVKCNKCRTEPGLLLTAISSSRFLCILMCLEEQFHFEEPSPLLYLCSVTKPLDGSAMSDETGKLNTWWSPDHFGAFC